MSKTPDRAAVEIRSPDFVFIDDDKGGLIVMPAKFARPRSLD